MKLIKNLALGVSAVVLALFLELPILAALPPQSAQDCQRALTLTESWIKPEQLKENLAELRQGCEPNCEKNGIFGPKSMIWEVSKVPLLGTFAQTTLSLQLAHPAGAQGVHDHSKRLMKDPIARFQSTFDYLWRMTYGTFTEAEKFATIIHHMHSRVTGTMKDNAGSYQIGDPYSANDPEALLWVHVTHWYGVLKTYETFIRPLNPSEKNAYIADTQKFGMLFGLPKELIPGTWQEFRGYYKQMLSSGKLKYTPDALKINEHYRKHSIINEKSSLISRIAWMGSDLVTANTLPEELATELGFKRSLVNRASYLATIKTIRAFYSRLPEYMKTIPIYRIAQARAEGRKIDPKDELAHLILVGK